MTALLARTFSDSLDGVVWKMAADPVGQMLFVESRQSAQREVRFSALSLTEASWKWKDQALPEQWWLSLEGFAGGRLIMTHFSSDTSPEAKNLVALDPSTREVQWWRNNFSLKALMPERIVGYDLTHGWKETILDPSTGAEIDIESVLLPSEQNLPILRPFQYREGSEHFNTVRDFLQLKCQLLPVLTVEYLELPSLILISAFIRSGEDLANYLLAFDRKGGLLLKEPLGEQLKGIATEAFFVFAEHVIFVKNKHELVTYRIL